MPFGAYDAATHAVVRSRALLEVARQNTDLPTNVRADMRRLSVVLAVAALDTYMHRLIVERAYVHDELPFPLARLDVAFRDLLDWADSAAVAARGAPHQSRPRVAVKRQLRDRLLRETFQNFNDVGRALNMAGVARRWDLIGEQMTPGMGAEAIRSRLNGIVMRRNQIVHEGDYERLERPRGARRNTMYSHEARADIDFVANLIDAIHA